MIRLSLHSVERFSSSKGGFDIVTNDPRFGVMLALASILLCNGCRATLPSDLRLDEISVVDVSHDAELKDMQGRYAVRLDDTRQSYLKITFATASNLGLIQAGGLEVDAFFCDTPQERQQEAYLALLSTSGLYAYGRDIAMSDDFPKELNTVPIKRYDTFIAVESIPHFQPPEVWDLRLHPRNVCLRIKQPDYPPVRSNVVEIPRSVIANALRSR